MPFFLKGELFTRVIFMTGYNRGDSYEKVIFDIFQQKGLLSSNSTRGGAGGGPDIRFIHNTLENRLEVKLDLRADYGQKMLKWKNGIWTWCVDDPTTKFYTEVGVLDIIASKNIIPNRYIIPKHEITTEHKQVDQKIFEDSIDVDIRALYSYYSHKNCYYIQIGGYGFYHLETDILGLGTPKFNCQMNLRLRAKTIHSIPIYKYGFYAVLKIKPQPITKSIYDLEEKEGRLFPPLLI
jgi:hypothetical protein